MILGLKKLLEKRKNLPTHGNELIGVRKDQASIFYNQTLSKAMYLLDFWGGAWLEE